MGGVGFTVSQQKTVTKLRGAGGKSANQQHPYGDKLILFLECDERSKNRWISGSARGHQPVSRMGRRPTSVTSSLPRRGLRHHRSMGCLAAQPKRGRPGLEPAPIPTNSPVSKRTSGIGGGGP